MAYKVAFEKFDSIDQLLKVINSRKPNTAFKERTDLASETGSESFTGTRSYNEALELITKGWTEPLDKVKAGMKNMNFKTNSQADKRRPTTGVVGYAPNVPNAIRGLPNSMIFTTKEVQKIKAVTIVYSVGVNCGWTTDEIITCGITALRLVNELEHKGIRVSLMIEAMSCTEGSDLSTVRVKVKDYREHLDLKKLAFPMINPSMFRRIAFKWLETCPQVTNSSYTCGYGSPMSNKNYNTVVETYKKQGLLNDNEYYISMALCKSKEQDIVEIAKEAGMAEMM